MRPQTPTNSTLNESALAYDRNAVTVGIVHFGVSSFFRTHVAEYIDDLLTMGARDLGICMVGVMPSDRQRVEQLAAQNALYTRVTVDDGHRDSVRVIGSVLQVLHVADDANQVLDYLTSPDVHTVTLTITEGGYPIDRDSGELTLNDREIRAAIDGTDVRVAVFGYLIRALRFRKAHGIEPFAVLSCDNLPGNGDITRRILTAMAAILDDELAAWIYDEIKCPNSMVDRITPATKGADIARLFSEYGIVDNWPAMCEPYRQWVIERNDVPARLPLHKGDATLVDDVDPYEAAKLRLLNGGHQVVGYLGMALGHTFVHEAVTDPRVRNTLENYMALEARPTLAPAPGIDFAEYEARLVSRFANAAIKDPLARLCADTSDRIPKWVVPVIRENAISGGSTVYGTFLLALWRKALNERSGPDRRSNELRQLAMTDDPLDFFKPSDLFGDLATFTRVRKRFLSLSAALTDYGTEATCAALPSERAK